MKTRTLHCQSGDHEWERESKRGRRPVNCPAHLLSSGRNETNGGTSRSVPAQVIEGTEHGESMDDRMRALTEHLTSLASKTRSVIKHDVECPCVKDV